MNAEYVNEVARSTMAVLKMSLTYLMSWGAIKFRGEVYKNMPALRFSVNGFLFAGDVVVALNEGADLYEVYCLDSDNAIVKSREGIYFDELVNSIDTMVEKEGDDIQYGEQIVNWLNKTA